VRRLLLAIMLPNLQSAEQALLWSHWRRHLKEDKLCQLIFDEASELACTVVNSFWGIVSYEK
jgi:hypothetical protein